MNKLKTKRVIIVCLIIVVTLVLGVFMYLKYFGISVCGGVDDRVCPKGFMCKYPEFKGPTFAIESGKCVIGATQNEDEVQSEFDKSTEDECTPPVGAPANWEGPYTCLTR